MSNDYLKSKIGFFIKDPSVPSIYVGNLTFEMTEEEIKELFDPFGDVNYVKVVRDNITHESRGIAFVQLKVKRDAFVAIEALNGSEVDGRTIKVSIAEENDEERAPKKKRRKPYKPYIAKKDREKEEK